MENHKTGESARICLSCGYVPSPDTGESGETYDVEMENYQVVELKRLREWQKYVREFKKGEKE